jgi:hypothetical protein
VTNKVKLESKREFKKRRVDGIASGLKAKVEWDQSWLETLSVSGGKTICKNNKLL